MWCERCDRIWTTLSGLLDAASGEPADLKPGENPLADQVFHTLAGIGEWFVTAALAAWEPEGLLQFIGSAMKKNGYAMRLEAQVVQVDTESDTSGGADRGDPAAVLETLKMTKMTRH